MRTGTLTNKTRYSGVMLRSIFVAVVGYVEKVMARTTPLAAGQRAALIRKSCSITYVYTRRGGCSGHAAYSGLRMRVRIARDEVDLATLIWLVQHEVYHLFGIRHQEMPSAVNHWSDAGLAAMREIFPDLFERYGDRVKEEPAPVKVALTTDQKRETKLASIGERIDRWESKLRRAENALKKLRKQKRYYEGQLELAAKGAAS